MIFIACKFHRKKVLKHVGVRDRDEPLYLQGPQQNQTNNIQYQHLNVLQTFWYIYKTTSSCVERKEQFLDVNRQRYNFALINNLF